MLTMLVQAPEEDALRQLANDPTFAAAAELQGCTVVLIENGQITFPIEGG